MHNVSILFIAWIGIINISDQEQTNIVNYRYINTLPSVNVNEIVEYIITISDNSVKHVCRSVLKGNYGYMNYERQLVMINGNMKSMIEILPRYNENNELIDDSSVKLELDDSDAICEFTFNGKKVVKKVKIPDNWIPKLHHISPATMYFASQLKKEMIGYKGLTLSYNTKRNTLEWETYRIGRVQKKIYKIGNKEYECDLYTIVRLRKNIPGIKKSFDPTEKFYVNNGRLIAYEYQSIIKVVMEN